LRDVRRKVKLDQLYIHRMCWWVDFTILFKTLGKFVARG
jgi:lipopolysaccharide/colanic/teichoic acid biosynthesis glycosyltransferase